MKKIMAVILSMCCVSLFISCNVAPKEKDIENNAIQTLNLEEIGIVNEEKETIGKISTENLPAVMEALYAKAETIYEQYDEIIIPAGNGDSKIVIAKKQSVISEDMTVAEVKQAEYEAYKDKVRSVVCIAVGLLKQAVGEERVVHASEIFGGETVLAVQNKITFESCTEYVFLGSSSEEIQQSIENKDVSEASFEIVMNHYVDYEIGGERFTLSYENCAPQLMEKEKALRAEYEAALAAEKGEVK